MLRSFCAISLLLLVAVPAAAEDELIDVSEAVAKAARAQLFFEVPERPVRYVARNVEYWGAGFDEGGFTETYAQDQWAAFELTGAKSGRTRVAALIALNDSSRELMDFLEDGDELTLTLTYLDRTEYMWTDAVLDKEETRELVLMEVETLSYSLPRIEGYSVLWYDRRDPEADQQRTHLSQDVLSRIGKRLGPDDALEIELAPGNIQVLFVPEGDFQALPLTIETRDSGPLVFGVLSGRMGVRQTETGAIPVPGDRGEPVLKVELPGALESGDLYLVRDQPSITFFLLHLPQDAATPMKLVLTAGQPPSAGPADEVPADDDPS